MKKNVLFFSPTFYDLPLNENIKKKYDNLSEVANVKVLAFSSQKKIHTESEWNIHPHIIRLIQSEHTLTTYILHTPTPTYHTKNNLDFDDSKSK